jgi:hypothetical protein
MLVAFSTGLLFYTASSGSFSHAFAFFTISIFLFLVIKAYESGKLRYHVLVGLSLGFVAIIRTVNVLVVFVYIFYGITNREIFVEKVKSLKTYVQFSVALGSFLLVFSIQSLYWLYAFGSLLTNPYSQYFGTTEMFSWFSPHVTNVLFSVHRGLFIWHPVYILIAIGLIIVSIGLTRKGDKRLDVFRIGLWLFVVFYVYVTSAWNVWDYGWSIGQRTFNDVLPIFALPLAMCIDKVFRWELPKRVCKSLKDKHKSWIPKIVCIPKIIFCILLILLVIRNINFSVAVRHGTFRMFGYTPGVVEYYGNSWYTARDFMFIIFDQERFEENRWR